jgi:hypothetical protein
VAYLLKARNVEPEETSVAREQHGNNATRYFLCGLHHVPMATGMHGKTEVLLETGFCTVVCAEGLQGVQLPL